MLYHSLTNPGKGVDVEQISFRLTEDLDTARFENAWNTIVDRYDVLRTSFDWTSGIEPRQVVNLDAKIRFHYDDLVELHAVEQETTIEQLKRADRLVDFEMNQSPLMRLTLLKLGTADWFGLWTFHHALLDGRSFPIILAEVFSLYDGQPPASLTPRTPFRDHVEVVHSQDLSKAKAFWTEYLDGLKSPTTAAIEGPEASSGQPFDAVECKLSVDVTVQVRDFAEKQSVTLNTLIQSAWSLLLGHLSSSADVTFGTTRACRHSSVPGADTMVGLLINTVPIRILIDGRRSLGDFLRSVRHQQQLVRDFETTPLTEIQRWSPLPSSSPIFDTIVVYDEKSLDARMQQLGAQATGRRFTYQGQTNYPLAVVAYGDDELALRLEYATDRLDDGTAERLLHMVAAIIESMPAQSAAPTADFLAQFFADEPFGHASIKPIDVVDWHQTAEEVVALLSTGSSPLTPTPPRHPSVIVGSSIATITSMRMDQTPTDSEPGTVIHIGSTSFTVATAEGLVEVRTLEDSSGSPLAPQQVLADAGIGTGDSLATVESAIESIAQFASACAPHEPYWINRLNDLEPATVPYGRKKHTGDAVGPPRIARLRVSKKLLDALQSENIDRADGLTAAFLMYLARVQNRLEFDVGYRSLATSFPHNIPGLFSPVVPMRFSCERTASLSSALHNFETARADTEAHLTFQEGMIARTPSLSRGAAKVTTPIVIDRTDGASSEQLEDCGLVFELPADASEVVLRWSPMAIEEVEVDRIVEQLSVFLDNLAEDLSRAIGSIETLSPEERSSLLGPSTSPETQFKVAPSLAVAFEEIVDRYPDRIALTHLDQHLTYAEVDRRANRVAHLLIAKNAGPDMLIGLAMERSTDLLIAMLGILKAGAGYLPLDPAYPAERIQYMVEHAKAPIVVTQQHLSDQLPTSSAAIVVIEEVEQQRWSEDRPTPATGPQDLAYVMYTSGSTGRPKGVQITHHNVLRLLAATQPWFGFNPDDVWTLFHSYSFDFTVWEIWGAFLYGGRLVVPTHETTRSPADFLDLLHSEGVTVLNQTPSAFRQLIDADRSAATRPELALRYVVFGGEALDLADLKPWVAGRGAEKPVLVNMFGITETTVHVTYRPLTADDIELNAGSLIGEPIPDLQLYVLDQWMQPSPIGMPGEIYVGGAGLARGYLDRPDLTKERFVTSAFSGDSMQRLYKTGDVARYLSNGELDYLGRSDHQIQLRGFRIELGEVESVLATHDGVAKVVVDVKQQASGDKQLIAYYLSTASPVDPAELKDLASRSLSDYMVPQHFIPLETLPLTPSGKLDRNALPSPVRTLREAPVLPSSQVERRIAAIWQELLELSEIGTRDAFFDIGGHSLLSIALANQLSDEFGQVLAVADIFRFPTIEAQARLVTEHRSEDKALVSADRSARQQRRARAGAQRVASRRRGQK